MTIRSCPKDVHIRILCHNCNQVHGHYDYCPYERKLQMTLVIGLGHKARQGKNSVANYMKEHDNRIKLYAFADEIKEYCKDHHNQLLTEWQLVHQTKQIPSCKPDPIYGFTPILQWYGTEVARRKNPNIWIEILAGKLEKEKPHIAVITDVRFENEAGFVKSKGGFLVDVIRIAEDGSQYRDPNRSANHPSEIALDKYLGWDFAIICKSGDLKGLKAKSIGVLNIIQNKAGELNEFVQMAHETIPIPGNPLDDATGFFDQGDIFEYEGGN